MLEQDLIVKSEERTAAVWATTARVPVTRAGSLIARILAAVAAAALVGCASNPVYEGGRAWNDGWRKGKVEQVGSARDIGYPQNYDCRYRHGGLGRREPGLFAVVGIRNMGRHRHHVVPLVGDTVTHVGDQVLTRPGRCEPPVQLTAR